MLLCELLFLRPCWNYRTVQNFFNHRNVFGKIHLGGIVFGDHHLDAVAVFQDPQLFELFAVFQAAVGQFRENVEKPLRVGIDAEVLVDVEDGLGVSSERDGRPGKIERESVFVAYDLDVFGVLNLILADDFKREGGHDDVGVG